MDLFEYQGKELYKKYDIATPNSMVVDSVEKIDDTIRKKLIGIYKDDIKNLSTFL